jgi:predicted dehydrogenase
MREVDRRDFLKSSAATLGGLTALTAAGAADKPNDKFVIAIMGVHGRGKGLLSNFVAQPDVEVAYICDVDSQFVPPAAKIAEQKQKRTPKVEKDIRKVLEDKDVNAIVIAAPDHWHAPATVWACQAGKHVYVEKPISHNLVEGQRMVQAARKYDRVVQVGTQRRSGEFLIKAAEFVRSGKLGKVPFARTWIAGNRPSIGHKQDGPVPEGVDYDLWLGPAPLRPFNPNRFHYEWHWNWDYGTGELGNNGIHGLDLIRWLLDLDAPLRITSGGGKFFYDDDRVTPDTQIATFDFEKTSVVWEHRIWAKSGRTGYDWVTLYGEKGTFALNDKGWRIVEDETIGEKPTELERAHARNFLDCIKEHKRPNADIEEGHKSTRLCHLGNIAYRLSRTLRFDGKTETIIDDPEATKMLGRSYRKGFEVPEKV